MAAVVALVALGVLPLLPGGDAGWLLLTAARAMILAVAAVPLTLLVGVAGLPVMSHAAAFGIGAYAVVVLDDAGARDAALSLPVAALAGCAFAALTGAVALRTTGVNFLMITLAFGQMAHYATVSLAGYGGDDGYSLFGRHEVVGQPLLDDPVTFHLLCLGALAASWASCRLVLASRLGRVLRAGAESPLRLEASGLNLFPARAATLALGGAWAGLAGALMANATEFAAPSYLTWQRSGELLFMVILGGQGSLAGAIYGVAAYLVAEEALQHLTENWRLPFGLLLVAVAVLARGGLAGAFAGGIGAWRR
jgi:branched-chain amino acid transport system permease protein